MINYLPIDLAEELCGGRLDRRHKYFLWDFGLGAGPEVCFEGRCLVSCSGCTEHGEGGTLLAGGYDKKRKMDIGGGCDECGYTGVRRESFPLPAEVKGKRAAA